MRLALCASLICEEHPFNKQTQLDISLGAEDQQSRSEAVL
jgi:hypothetical protein